MTMQDIITIEVACKIKDIKFKFMDMAENHMRKSGRHFIIDERNKRHISNLFNYLIGIEGELDQNKGIWLQGGLGTGKSTLMQVFAEFMREYGNGWKVVPTTYI